MAEQDNIDLWEKRQLGAEAQFAEPSSKAEDNALDDSLGLQLITVRVPKELTDDLKKLAKAQGMSYQTFLRQILVQRVRNVKQKGRG